MINKEIRILDEEINEEIKEATKLIQDMPKEKQQRVFGYVEGIVASKTA